MTLPYYKRFPRDFLDGTVGMTLEQKGAYGIVIDLIFSRGGKLPDDARYIAGQLGCSVRKWNSIKNYLVEEGKLSIRDDVISNKRADYLLEETRKYRDKQAENRRKPKEISEEAKPSLPSRERVQKTDIGGVDVRDVRAKLMDAAGLSEADMMTRPGLVSPVEMIHLMEPAQGEPCDLDLDIIPAVQTCAAQLRKRNDTLRNWSYCREAAIRNRDQRLAPAPDVQQRPANGPPGQSSNPALRVLSRIQATSRGPDEHGGVLRDGEGDVIEHEPLVAAGNG
jgi:uncharacterized protein YdaU (DUF1376 family)